MKREKKRNPEQPSKKSTGSARPLLALLRDLKAAGLPTEPAGTAAVRALAARDDILGTTLRCALLGRQFEFDC